MKIYFNMNKNACDFRPMDCIAEIDESIWSIYGRTEPGIGWDIIDGTFVPFMMPEDIERSILERRRKLERKSIYEQTEIELAQLEERYVNEDISDQEYTTRRKSIMIYRKSVRSTAEQSDYPLNVIYPNPPEEDMQVPEDMISEPDIPETENTDTENNDSDATEVNDPESEPEI